MRNGKLQAIPESDLPDHKSGGHSVYALLDPDSGEVRYIGVTWNAKQRYATHTNWRSARKGSPLREWLRELDAAGKKPDIAILLRLTGPLSWLAKRDAERAAIRFWSTGNPGRLLQKVHVSDQRKERPERLFTLDGKTQCMAAWAREIGISRERLRQRLIKYSTLVALTTPKGEKPLAAVS